MPRQSRGRSSGPARSAPAAAPVKSRGAHTAAAPAGYAPAHAPAPYSSAAAVSQPKQPGMMAQMAATAGSVAAGSVIGHGISSMLFGGGSSSTPAEAQAPVQQQQQQQQQYQNGTSCDFHAREFTKCLENNTPSNCSWYLDQLKACQQAAAPY